MPLPFALPVAWLIGFSLAWTSRNELARSEVPLLFARPFLVTAAFAAIVFAPVVGYFVALHGDWSYLYVVRWSRVPSALDLVLVVVAAAQMPLAFAVATPWAIGRRGSALLRVSGVILLVIAIGCVVGAQRLASSASYAQFHGDFGTAAIGKVPLGRGVLLSWVAILLGWVWSLNVLRKHE